MKKLFFITAMLSLVLSSALFAGGQQNSNGSQGSNGNGQTFTQTQQNVDISEDLFTNRTRFRTVAGDAIAFVDENTDGVADVFQNSDQYANLNLGTFVDENADGICDLFQTQSAYNILGMANFVDSDGDGLCDNYQQY